MRCPACNTENPVNNSFCESCGAKLGSGCAYCGYRNSPSARFCGSCGVPLFEAEGELKQATVLFADVVGSTELIAGLNPEQALHRLQPAVEMMCAAVRQFDGTVVRTLGDGIMALFGAPQSQEGHALLACEAALAMQAELPESRTGLSIRIGLDSGRVLSGAAGMDPTNTQGAYGLTVHLASRLQGLAEPGGTCLTQNCYRLVRPFCEVRVLGRRALKGVSETIEIYSLLSLKPAVASQQFRRTKLSTFRGRARDLSIMQRTLENIQASPTKVIGISGLAGSGKSRLCFEFAEWARNSLVPVVEARVQPYGRATPLQLVLDFMRLSLGILPTEDTETSRRRIAQQILAIAPTFEVDLPLIYDFLGVSEGHSQPPQFHPKARHARLLDVVRHIVRQRGATTSIILIEDLHWLDEASTDFIATLVDAVADTRTLLIINYRPGYEAAWMRWLHFQELVLPELTKDETILLVRDLIGDRPELSEIAHRVVDRSGGNPFFAEELVRSLADQGIIDGEIGNYRMLGFNFGDALLPATVEAVISARIDCLRDTEKAVLQIAAIIGKEFPLRILRDVAGPYAAQIDKTLADLCGAELIQAQSTIDEHQFAFRHPLIQEVAYASQLKSRRGLLHAKVAVAMADYYHDRINEFAGLLSYHYEAAGQPGEAAHYAAVAAQWVGSTNPAQAIKHWHKVRALLQNEPRTPPGDSQRIMADAQIAWLGWREGMTADAAHDLVQEGIALARETDNSMIPILLFVDGRIILASGGSADVYVQRMTEALALLEQSPNVGRTAMLNCALSQAYGWAGYLNEALAANDAAAHGLVHVEKFDHQFLGYNVNHWVLALRGQYLVRLGRFAEAEECLQNLLRIEVQLGDPTVQFIPHLSYVELAWCRGDLALAKRHAAHVIELGDKSGMPYLAAYGFACRGTVHALERNFAMAAQSFAEGWEFVRQTEAARQFESELVTSLAECYLRKGDPQRAEAVAAEAIILALRRGTRLAECRASIIRGAALHALRGTLSDEIARLFHRAKELIGITGARIYEPLLEQAQADVAAPHRRRN